MENEIKVFGAPEVSDAQINTDEPDNVVDQGTVETTEVNNEQATDLNKTTEDQTTETVENTTKTVESKTDDKVEKSSEGFKVSFNKEVSEPAKTETKTEPVKQETTTVTEEMVSNFLKERFGIEVNDFTELSKKEELPEEVAKFKKFYEETGGRSHKDFHNAQKDWNKESKDDTIKEYLKYENPNLSDEDIETQVDLLKVTQDDEDELDERELKRRKLDYNREYSKALDFMSKKSQEFKTPEKPSNTQQKPPTTEEIAKAHKPYWEARDRSLEKLNEIDISIKDVGDIKLNITEDQKNLISKHTQTTEDFFSRWQDKKGAINTDQSSLDTAWSIPEIRESLISSMLEQANTLILDKFSKKNRNVKLEVIKQIDESAKEGGLTVLGNNDISKAGTPLI